MTKAMVLLSMFTLLPENNCLVYLGASIPTPVVRTTAGGTVEEYVLEQHDYDSVNVLRRRRILRKSN